MREDRKSLGFNISSVANRMPTSTRPHAPRSRIPPPLLENAVKRRLFTPCHYSSSYAIPLKLAVTVSVNSPLCSRQSVHVEFQFSDSATYQECARDPAGACEIPCATWETCRAVCRGQRALVSRMV